MDSEGEFKSMRIDRLLAMTVLLLSRGRVSAAELAERFEVSTKTIYRDMETLNQAGIPIVAHQGSTGGFEIMQQYTIHRQFLTLDEITSVVAAVKGIGTVLDDRAMGNLLGKVQSMLSKQDIRETEQKGARFVFDFNPWGQGVGARAKFDMLRQAAEESRLIQFRYSSINGKETERVAEPLTLILKGPLWYLYGYCRLREEFRVFRLTRMQDIRVISETVPRRPAPELKEQFRWEPQWSGGKAQHVVIHFSPKVRYRVLDVFDPTSVEILKDGSLKVSCPYLIDDWFYGLMLSFGADARIEQPAEAAAEIRRRAEKITALYTESGHTDVLVHPVQ